MGCRPSGHPGSASLCGPGQRGHPALGPGALHPSWWGERGPGGGPPWTSGCPAPQRVAPPPTDQVRRSLPPPGVCSALASHCCRAPGVLVTSSERRSRSDALMAPFRAAQQVWPLPGGAANSGAPRLPRLAGAEPLGTSPTGTRAAGRAPSELRTVVKPTFFLKYAWKSRHSSKSAGSSFEFPFA